MWRFRFKIYVAISHVQNTSISMHLHGTGTSRTTRTIDPKMIHKHTKQIRRKDLARHYLEI